MSNISTFTQKNKRLLLMPHDQISNLKTSKFSAASKSKHLKNEKNVLIASHFHQFLKFKQIINQYLRIYPVENTSNISKESGDYKQTC